MFLSILSIGLVGCSETVLETEEVIDQDPNMTSLRINFGEDGDSEWFTVNDDVMGGESTSDAYTTDDAIIFSGEVSTDNNGGFVSLRSPNGEYELTDFTQIEVSYRSIGQHFTMILADEAAWYMPEFKHELFPVHSEWTTATTSLSDFKQYRMTNFGEVETDVQLTETLLSEVIRIELRNSEFNNGEFQLEIDYIEFQGFLD
jgi:NADH dehydrogenase [ubiquinone] 1 alpha subcomplex assembly factor 1